MVLVTGGAGFIGSGVVRQFINASDATVINVDKLTYAGNLESLLDVAASPRYHFERVDICDGAAVERLFTHYQPDAVMHLAAESHMDRSIDGPAEFIQTNIVNTKKHHKTTHNKRTHHTNKHQATKHKHHIS